MCTKYITLTTKFCFLSIHFQSKKPASALHFKMESICSLHRTDNRVIIVEFNLHNEIIQKNIFAQFSKTLSKAKFKTEEMESIIKSFSSNLTLDDFDNKCLKPDIFIELCGQLNVNPIKLYDQYYSFVFSDYSHILNQYAIQHHLNQKQLSKKLRLSSNDIGLFEKSMKYPSRHQYKKIMKVLKDDISKA